MSVMPRLTMLAMVATLATVVGCAHQPPPKTTTTITTTRNTVTPVSTTTTTAQRAPHRATADDSSTAAAPANLPATTGIPACDDYLASYMACHRAANIFVAPGQLQSHYNEMRTGLLRDSQDPDIRPQLAARCNSLASQLRDALHGKSCDVNAAPASTSP